MFIRAISALAPTVAPKNKDNATAKDDKFKEGISNPASRQAGGSEPAPRAEAVRPAISMNHSINASDFVKMRNRVDEAKNPPEN